MAVRGRPRREVKPSEAAPAAATSPTSARTTTRRTRKDTEEPSFSNTGRRYDQDKAPSASAPVARRGAPPSRGRAQSIASIATEPPQMDDDSQDEEDREQAIEEEPEAEESGSNINVQGGEQEQEEEAGSDGEDSSEHDLEIMLMGFPDLARTAQEYLDRLIKDQKAATPVHRKMLDIKKNAYENIRQLYKSSSANAIFLEWSLLEAMEKEQRLPDHASTTLVMANLATLLDWIKLASDASKATLLLDELDSTLPVLFRVQENQAGDFELALRVRTARCIQLLSQKTAKAKQDPREIIASVFCQSYGQGDAASLIANGPFRTLAGKSGEVVDKLCSERAEAIYRLTRNDQKGNSVKQLKHAYPLDGLLKDLWSWAIATYKQTGEGDSPEVEHAIESQPIRRIEDKNNPSKVLFQTFDSIRNMLSGKSSSAIAEPELLPAEASQSTPMSTRKRKHAALSDDDNQDGFETDTRTVDESRAATLRESRPPPARRARTDDAAPASALADARHMTPSRASPGRMAESPALAQMRRQKQALMQEIRAANASGNGAATVVVIPRYQQFQVRHKWSDMDTMLLVRLVDQCDANWAMIARVGGNEFDPPRNQQSCRDRARNFKVDLLLTDSVLPPQFDKVALSKKEIERLVRAGKNPFRRESDVDASGYVLNTDYDNLMGNA